MNLMTTHPLSLAQSPHPLLGPYKDTVLLPDTPFGMRANSAVREPEIQAFWEAERVYEKLLESATAGTFTLHDGPPYANGNAHLGHALNKILKSMVVNHRLLAGKAARYVPGWDCHGLPIELKVLQSIPAKERAGLTPAGIRARARDFALATVADQASQFRRYGVFGDWDAPYLTLQPAYEAAQLRVFGRLALEGHVYRGYKPVHWSPSSRTALAEAELEYPPGHTSRSAYVALPVVGVGGSVPPGAAADALAAGDAALAVWTTTAWTLPANVAVAVNEDLVYAVVRVEGKTVQGGQAPKFATLVVAEALIPALASVLGLGAGGLTTVATLTGAQLAGTTYAAPWNGGEGAAAATDPAAAAAAAAATPPTSLAGQPAATPLDWVTPRPVVIGGDYITTEAGTGLVHTAPGHGAEDYGVGLRLGLGMPSPVDDAGRFTPDAGPDLAGKAVLTDGTAAVLDALAAAGTLLKEEAYAHKYPYDWRTKKPTIFRATAQWFVSVDGFREAALRAAAGVTWVPPSGARRIASMVEGRGDWCISRQRAWGVPIPVLYERATGLPLLTQASVEHLASLVGREGSDAFFDRPVADLLPPGLAPRAEAYERRAETMDVWFDSGTSWAGVLEARPGLAFPADLYLEGSDQHRGWFQSSLLTAAAARGGQAPYKAVLTHGFALDEAGNKMSKSLGNVVDPRTIIEGGADLKKQPAYGADVLRLWVASTDYTGDVSVGPAIIAQAADAYRKLRGTLRFLLGCLTDFDPAADAIPVDALPAVDRYALGRLADTLDEAGAAYEGYAFAKALAALVRFAGADLSSFYLDASKDRLYLGARSSPDRRACQTVCAAALVGLAGALAPIAPHLAEDAWAAVPWAKKGGAGGAAAWPASVFLARWPVVDPAWRAQPPAEAASVCSALEVRAEVNQALEAARRAGALGAGLDAEVAVWAAEPGTAAGLAALNSAPNTSDPLRYVFIVSSVALVGSEAEALAFKYGGVADLPTAGRVAVGVRRAGGAKCGRCWSYSAGVGADAAHPTLCERCGPIVIQDWGLVSEPVVAAGVVGP